MKKKKIPIFQWDFPEDLRHEFHQGVEQIFNQAYLTNYTFTQEFEKKFSQFQHSNFSVATSNGTGALELMLLAALNPGDEVLLPSNTFIATWAAVKRAGLCPVLCDVEENYFSLDPIQVEKKITNKTKAILTVHVGGIIAPTILDLQFLAKKNGLLLFEDASHAHGACFQNKMAGQFGLAASFSHFLTKSMTTGEGGSVVTNDESLLKKIQSLRQFGKSMENPLLHQNLSGNYKMNEFSALLGLLELKRLPERQKKRQLLAQRYEKNLQNSSWKTIMPPQYWGSSYYKQIILSPIPREKLQNHLRQKGIHLTGGVYYHPLHQQPVVQKDLSFSHDKFPVADKFSTLHFCPPCYPELEIDDIDYICQSMLELNK